MRWRKEFIAPISCGSKRDKSGLSIGVLLLTAASQQKNLAIIMGSTTVKLSVLSALWAGNTRDSLACHGGVPALLLSLLTSNFITETRDKMKPGTYPSSCWHFLVSGQLGARHFLFVCVDMLGASLVPPFFPFYIRFLTLHHHQYTLVCLPSSRPRPVFQH